MSIQSRISQYHYQQSVYMVLSAAFFDVVFVLQYLAKNCPASAYPVKISLSSSILLIYHLSFEIQ